MERTLTYTVTTSSGEVLITTGCVSSLVIALDGHGLSTYTIVQILKDSKSDSGHVLNILEGSTDKDYLPP